MSDLQLAIVDFNSARAKALNTYAALEQSLASLFNTLLATEIRKSYVVFSKLINARARRELLAQLMKLSFGDEYDVFFGSLLKELSRVDATRNKIVHWIILTARTGGKEFNPDEDIFLAEHPDIFADSKLLKSEVEDFEHRTDFLRLIIYYFDMFLQQGDLKGDPKKTPWQVLFRKAIVYPPPDGHPLRR